ncbi:MAG: mannosyltransferase, partial [Sphingomicrobium sp.]
MSLRDERRLFWAILVVAIALRALAFNPYSAHHPDETIQYLEQAHRLDFGYGIVPWEFRYFIRSWLIPLLLAGPMALGERIDPGGTLYLILPRLLVALFNLSP